MDIMCVVTNLKLFVSISNCFRLKFNRTGLYFTFYHINAIVYSLFHIFNILKNLNELKILNE